jgi:hypothetical protein
MIKFIDDLGSGLWCLMPLSTIFQFPSTRRKPPTCRKSLTNFRVKLIKNHKIKNNITDILIEEKQNKRYCSEEQVISMLEFRLS